MRSFLARIGLISVLFIFCCQFFLQIDAHAIQCQEIFKPNTYNKTFQRIQQGGFVNLKNGSLIEGSVVNGGLQPHTKIDFAHPSLKALIDEANSIRHLEVERRIQIITESSHRLFIHKEYADPTYLFLMARGRQVGELSFGEYIAKRAGTCREHAIFMHLALQAAGVPNKLTYALYRHFNYDRSKKSFEVLDEDHAFVVVEHAQQRFIVDSYFHEAHGQSYDHLLTNMFITKNSPRAPWAYDLWSAVPTGIDRLPIHIIKIHNFPVYYIP